MLEQWKENFVELSNQTNKSSVDEAESEGSVKSSQSPGEVAKVVSS